MAIEYLISRLFWRKVKVHPIGIQTKPNDVGETPRRLTYESKIILFMSPTQGKPRDQIQKLKDYSETKGNYTQM